jgi:hypothetical protein
MHTPFVFSLLVIALPLDVWDILVAEQPSSEEWHIVIRSRVVRKLIVYKLIEYEGFVTKLLLHDRKTTLVAVLLSLPYPASASSIFEGEMQH